ncbi:mce related protein [bacterium BMS3Bbin12]|nr:mce related protein [bacterium BMS3Bbin12]GBE49302.1 mce related protein [bacterium BMS3Bbin13]HDJ85674.1 MCE family protein [Chromatiales bacterium]
MEDKAHAIVAVTFLILIGLGAGFVAWWMQAGTPQVKIYDIVSPYSVSGLSADAPVQYKGVGVGSVQSVKLDPGNPRDILIRISLVADAPVTRATYAELSSQGITGMSYIALNEGPGDRTPLPTSPAHPARIPIHRGLLPKLEQSGKALLHQTDVVSKRLGELLNARNRAHVGNILANLDGATRRLITLEDAALPTLRGLAKLTEETHRMTTQARDLLTTLQRDAETLHAVGGAAVGTARTLRYDTLPRIGALTGTLNRTATQVDRLTRELRADPGALLFGAPVPRPGPGEPGFRAPAAGGTR